MTNQMRAQTADYASDTFDRPRIETEQRWSVSCFGCFPKRNDTNRDLKETKNSNNSRDFCAPVPTRHKITSLKDRPRDLDVDGGELDDKSGDHHHSGEWDCWSSFDGEIVYYQPPELKTDEQYFLLNSEFQSELIKTKPSKNRLFSSHSEGKRRKSLVQTDYHCKSAGEGSELYLDSFSSNSSLSTVPTVMFSSSFWKVLDRFRLNTTASATAPQSSAEKHREIEKSTISNTSSSQAQATCVQTLDVSIQ